MPVFEVTAPDGKTYEVEAPEGATADEALAYFQSQYKGAQRESASPLLDALDVLDRTPAASQQEGDATGYIAQQAKKGFAAGLGMPVDMVTNVLNLGIAGYGAVKGELGGTDLPELIRDPVGGSKSLERLFLTNDAIAPEGPISETIGRFVRDLSAAAVPIAGMAGRPAAFLPRGTNPVQQLAAQTQGVGTPLAVGTGLTALASAGGETARSMVPEPYKDAADISGMLVAGVAAPAMVASRLEAVNALRDATKANKVNRAADQYVDRQIESDVRTYPRAAENLSEAVALQDDIPGLQYRVGQGSGVPSLMDMERRVATAGPENFNRRALQDRAQRVAILRKAEQDVPLLAGRDDLAPRLAATQARRAELADRLPQVAQDEVGAALRSARSSMKGRYDQIAAEKFDAPVLEARRLNVEIDAAPIVQRAKQIFANPLLKFDEGNAPEVARRVLAINREDATGSGLLDARGAPMPAVERAGRIPFEDLKGLREAVNQDIAREAGGYSPGARMRLKALVELKGEIDRAAQQAPESVKTLYNSAVTWYRDVYAPKFLRGVNLKQAGRDITGEMRIADERLAGQYFKKLSSTPMERFLTLYGENPQAMRTMENHILDTYRREVVKNGFIDPKKHDIFLRNYGPAINKLPEFADGVKNIGAAARVLAEREAQLAQAQSVISKGQLAALRYDNPDLPGLDPKKLQAFVTKSGGEFSESVATVYGEKVAKDHLANLQKIAKAAEIADRGRLGEAAAPRQGLEPFDFQRAVGFTPRTLFNMIRAVTTGRTSVEDLTFTLGAQAGTHRITQALIAAEERAISDPQTARLIAEAMKNPANSEAGKVTLGKLLEKGGLYLVGEPKYEQIGRYRTTPMAIEATSYGANRE